MAREPEILFVDDEDSIRLTLPLMLETFGFKVSTAATVTEALRTMTERKFDVLISDMNIEVPGTALRWLMPCVPPSRVR
jgi:DNA-binding NtrC family response regulator